MKWDKTINNICILDNWKREDFKIQHLFSATALDIASQTSLSNIQIDERLQVVFQTAWNKFN